jgi:hypothetical protein
MDCTQAGCAWVRTVKVIDVLVCSTTPEAWTCMDRAREVPPTGSTAFYREGPWGLEFFAAGCAGRHGLGQGAWLGPGFTECTGGSADPEGCACFCVGDVCWGERQWQAMAACLLPMPCEVLSSRNNRPGYDSVETCLLQALVEGTPAWLRFHGEYGDGLVGEETFLLGGGKALFLRSDADVMCGSCCTDYGDGLLECDLQDPAWFGACLVATEEEGQRTCLTAANWFTSCVPTTPRCATDG